jgi:hypothetical protein
VYNQNESSIMSAVPEGCLVAVKEPFYKNNGAVDDFMICVDHPSDVLLLRFTDPIIPDALRLGPVLKSADEWRVAGDEAFIQRDFPTAVFWYCRPLTMHLVSASWLILTPQLHRGSRILHGERPVYQTRRLLQTSRDKSRARPLRRSAI